MKADVRKYIAAIVKSNNAQAFLDGERHAQLGIEKQ